MSKAVLVIDMPESCKTCCFCRGLNACKLKKYLNRDGLTTVYTVDKQIMDGTKPDWCPLVPLPEKATEPIDSEDVGKDYSEGTMDGWNACLDAICGGAK